MWRDAVEAFERLTSGVWRDANAERWGCFVAHRSDERSLCLDSECSKLFCLAPPRPRSQELFDERGIWKRRQVRGLFSDAIHLP